MVNKAKFELKWTEKIELSQRIQDPLGIYILKYLENFFLPGITTQTERLRYFSFLTWAWNKIKEKELSWDEILDMEKIFTLISGLHHQADKKPPKGIRNLQDAIEFLKQNDIINTKKFTRFGRNNRQGYGNYYYRGPLWTLNIFGRNQKDEIFFSIVGKDIALIYEKLTPSMNHLFFKKELQKKDLKRLSKHCLCGKEISKDEREIWRYVFFGFTKMKSDEELEVDWDKYQKFLSGKLNEQENIPFLKISEEEYLRTDLDDLILEMDENLQNKTKMSIARRYTLFLIMKIILEANPPITPSWELDQIIRDGIYFKQIYDSNGTIKKIDFGNLEPTRKLWEVYVHNLYYISVFECIFNIILDFLKRKTMGASMEMLLSSINISQIVKILRRYEPKISGANPTLSQIEQIIKEVLRGKKTSLEHRLNERDVFFKLQDSTEVEEKLAYLILLFILLKYRFDTFSEEQRGIFSYKENKLLPIEPTERYKSLMTSTIDQFLAKIFNFIKNRHKYIATRKYHFQGTKAWLFTEEEGILYYYDVKRDYNRSFYREAKWRNVIEILHDLGLLSINRNISLTNEGKKWLARIT
jgi:hypothetical protein